MKNLMLICGGQSPEHEISLRSAKNVLTALDRNKYAVQVIGISKAGGWYALEEEELNATIGKNSREVTLVPGRSDCFQSVNGSLGRIDIVFPLLHGPNGEDGAIQGMLKLLNVPFVGTGVLGSAVCMDKDIAKRILKHEGIPVANWKLLTREDTIPAYNDISDKLGIVVYVKPANMGSSVGVHTVSSKEQWKAAVADAFTYDRKVIVEEKLFGRELECAVSGNETPEASGVGEVISGDLYSYEEKYADTSTAQTIIPATVSDEELDRLRTTAIKAYKALNCFGLSRVDMFLNETGEVYVNEVNTIPGFTSISMYPKLWLESGITYAALLDRLVDLAIEL